MKEFSSSQEKGEMVLVQMEPVHIDFFNKLIEGYDNLALVTTLDAKLGKVALWVTEKAKKDLMAVLHCLPIPLNVLSAE